MTHFTATGIELMIICIALLLVANGALTVKKVQHTKSENEKHQLANKLFNQLMIVGVLLATSLVGAIVLFFFTEKGAF